MRAIARILLLLLIVGCSVRFVATFIGLVLAVQHPTLFSYASGRCAASALMLAIVAWAFRRLGADKTATPPALPGREG